MVSAVQENYFDLSALHDIKSQSKSDPKESLKAVASEFESIFMKMMLKSMRDANMGNPLFDSDSAKFYREMYDDQLALNLSKQGGIGLANTLVSQLEKYLPQQAQSKGSSEKTDKVDVNPVEASDNNIAIKSPKQFVEKLLPHAKEAGKELGVEPKVLLAQAALETGWGKYVIQQKDGVSSHNLFNIKADKRWSGKDASISTVEFLGNKPQTQKANFRVYESYEESFKDYVKFLQNSPRYSHALKNAHNPEAFTNSLQSAGYATDPQYAKKIQRILGDKPLNDALHHIHSVEPRSPIRQMGF